MRLISSSRFILASSPHQVATYLPLSSPHTSGTTNPPLSSSLSPRQMEARLQSRRITGAEAVVVAAAAAAAAAAEARLTSWGFVLQKSGGPPSSLHGEHRGVGEEDWGIISVVL